MSSQNRQRRKFCPIRGVQHPRCAADWFPRVMSSWQWLCTSSPARRRQPPLNLNAIDTRQMTLQHFFLKTVFFFFFFCRMWIAGNERGPTQSRFSCSDSDFCTKPLLAAHYTGTVQPNQRAGLGLHCCHGERIICIRKKKKEKEKEEDFCTVALTSCPPQPLATGSCFSS